jgi:hypothetical protein
MKIANASTTGGMIRLFAFDAKAVKTPHNTATSIAHEPNRNALL